jgi:hypothetical protein
VDEGNAFGFEVPYIVEKIWTRAQRNELTCPNQVCLLKLSHYEVSKQVFKI